MDDNNLNPQKSCKNTTIPTEIGRAEDSVKEAFSKSVKNVSENSTEVRHRVTQISLESGDKIRRGIQSVKDQLWDGKLLKHSELPKWMQDNEFILDFHRPEFRSFYVSLKNVFRHNTYISDLIQADPIFRFFLPFRNIGHLRQYGNKNKFCSFKK
jgi:hypothetical protein